MRVKTDAGRRQQVARAIRFLIIAADTNTIEEFERERRTVSEEDREYSNLIADQLIAAVDALLEPIRADLEKLDKPVTKVMMAGADIAAIQSAVRKVAGSES